LVVGANVTGTGIDIANEAELYLPWGKRVEAGGV
jgi:hypothetical protein